MPGSLIWGAITERWIIQTRGGAAFPITIVSLAFYVCLPPSSYCLHNHLLTLISISFPQFVLFYSSPLYSIVPPTKFNAPPPVPCFSPPVLLSDMPTGTLTLSPVPLPATGEWSLITVHGLYDEMPLAHLTSSCQLPLTSHCLCALQAVLAACFNTHNATIPHVWIHVSDVFCQIVERFLRSALNYTNGTYLAPMWWQCSVICWKTLFFTVIKRETKSNLFSSAVNCLRILK